MPLNEDNNTDNELFLKEFWGLNTSLRKKITQNVSRETENTLIKNAIYYGKLIPESNFHKKLDVKTY